MVKEFNLIARIVGTAFIVLMIGVHIGFGSAYSFLGIGLFIFIQSFAFQYAVFHPTLKQISSKKLRARILLIVLIVSALLFVYTCNRIPNIDTIKKVDGYLENMAMWAGFSAAFGSVLVAISCTRRVFQRYGGL